MKFLLIILLFGALNTYGQTPDTELPEPGVSLEEYLSTPAGRAYGAAVIKDSEAQAVYDTEEFLKKLDEERAAAKAQTKTTAETP